MAPDDDEGLAMAINAPEGTRDLLPDEALFWNQFKQTAAEVFGTYGYLPIDTPIMEQTELFVRGIGEATDVVSKEMFTAISGENLRLIGQKIARPFRCVNGHGTSFVMGGQPVRPRA